ncbi:MAG TPA: helix-turn-helix domain-containing protein [Vicinamibacterales bacterium]
MDAREQLLQAALKVYAASGFRGATTKRIAHEAGVNEVTLFRHFGSKEALLNEALAWKAEQALDCRLPEHPVDPEAELGEFCLRYHAALWESRDLIRVCMGEITEFPEAIRAACQAPNRLAEALEAYLERLRTLGLATGNWLPRNAGAMLMGTVFSDAMGRDCMPQRYPDSPEVAVRAYVSLFLQAIGASSRALSARAPGLGS